MVPGRVGLCVATLLTLATQVRGEKFRRTPLLRNAGVWLLTPIAQDQLRQSAWHLDVHMSGVPFRHFGRVHHCKHSRTTRRLFTWRSGCKWASFASSKPLSQIQNGAYSKQSDVDSSPHADQPFLNKRNASQARVHARITCAKRVEWAARIGFPLLFLSFSTSYFLYYTPSYWWCFQVNLSVLRIECCSLSSVECIYFYQWNELTRKKTCSFIPWSK